MSTFSTKSTGYSTESSTKSTYNIYVKPRNIMAAMMLTLMTW